METNDHVTGCYWDNWDYDATNLKSLSPRESVMDDLARTAIQAKESKVQINTSERVLPPMQKKYSLLSSIGFIAIKQVVNKAFSSLLGCASVLGENRPDAINQNIKTPHEQKVAGYLLSKGVSDELLDTRTISKLSEKVQALAPGKMIAVKFNGIEYRLRKEDIEKFDISKKRMNTTDWEEVYSSVGEEDEVSEEKMQDIISKIKNDPDDFAKRSLIEPRLLDSSFSEELFKDFNFFEKVISKNPKLLDLSPVKDLCQDFRYFQIAARIDSKILEKEESKKFYGNAQNMLFLILDNYEAFLFASENLKNNPKFVLTAGLNNIKIAKWIPPEMIAKLKEISKTPETDNFIEECKKNKPKKSISFGIP